MSALSGIKSFAEDVSNPVVAISINLAGFSAINDLYGWATGEELLTIAVDRIREVAGERQTLVAAGGRFLVCVQWESLARCHQFATALLERIEEPIPCKGGDVALKPVAGISTPQFCGAAARMLYEADFAMRCAMSSISSRLLFFSDAQVSGKFQCDTSGGLVGLLDCKRFHLAYQPQIDLRSGKIAGYEALLRLSHPELGQVSPLGVIRVAERNGLIASIGNWVIRNSLQAMKACRQGAIERLAINVSPRQMIDPGFASGVAEMSAEFGVDPRCIEIEVTETCVVVKDAEAALRNLAAHGFQIVLDDFGSEYASLSNLKRLPVSKIKIDKQFVRGAVSDDRLLRALVDIAHIFGVKTLAEGVEDAATAEVVISAGFDEAQGFFYGHSIDRMVA